MYNNHTFLSLNHRSDQRRSNEIHVFESTCKLETGVTNSTVFCVCVCVIVVITQIIILIYEKQVILIKLLLSQGLLYWIWTRKINKLQCKIRLSHESFQGLPADVWVCCMQYLLLTLELSFKPKASPQTKETHKRKKATHKGAWHLSLGFTKWFEGWEMKPQPPTPSSPIYRRRLERRKE